MRVREIIPAVWRYSWLLTVPIAVATLAWLLPVWRDTRQFVVYHPASMHRSSDIDLNLRQIAVSRLAGLKADLMSSWRSRWKTATPSLPTIDLFVSTGAQARLNSYLPKSGKENWVAAKVRFPGNGLEKVSVRYRGDSLHHWGLTAKSWLLRAPKNEPILGQRRWNVILPRWRAVSSYYVNLHMAAKMGILAPEPSIVNLRVNGRQHGGVHLLMPPEDESFLRSHDRLPGDFYSGDMSTMDDRFAQEAPIAGLWELPWLWPKASTDRNRAPDSHLPLEILFQRIHSGTPEALAEILDLPAWAQFSAYMQLFDGSHMDMGHNWKLYYSPGKLTFEPVLADGNGLPDEINHVAKDVPGLDLSVTTPLLARLHQNHEFLRLKNEALARFFATNLNETYFIELDRFVTKVAPTLDIYPQLDWIGTVDGAPLHYFTGSDLRARAEKVKPELQRWFNAQRQQVTLRAEHVQVCHLPDQALRIQMRGYAGAKISLPAAASAPSLKLTIYDENKNPKTADVSDRLKSAPDGRWLLDLTLLAARRITFPKAGGQSGVHEVKPVTYDLKYSGVVIKPGDIELVGLMGERIRPVPSSYSNEVNVESGNNNILPPKSLEVQWRGVVEIEGLREIKGNLTLAPGTHLKMGPDATLVVRGRLLARGTAVDPIAIERRDAAAAWGSLAVIGPQADHTALEFCRISGGSGRNTPFVGLSGMVSIYGANEVTIENCSFTRNSAFEHLLYAASSSISIRSSTFSGAHRNGIHFDLCQARLEQVLVERAGNNAVTFWNSDGAVVSSRIKLSGNSGISAEQRSKVVIFNSEVAENQTGILCKDGSNVVFYNSLLQDNRSHLVSYHRDRSNPGRPTIVLAKSSLLGGETTCDLKDSSSVTLEDSQSPVSASNSRLKRDFLSDQTSTAKSPTAAAVYEKLDIGRRWPLAQHTIRGLSNPSALPESPYAPRP